MLVEPDRRHRLDIQARPRRTVVILRCDADRERLAGADRPVRGGQLHLKLWRHEILDPELDAADRRRLGVKLQFGAPAPHSGIARQLVGVLEAVELAAAKLAAIHFDPVGPHQPQGQRQAGSRLGLVVAHQSGEMHAFTGPVDATVGVEIGVDRSRLRPAADPAVGQVEGGTTDFEEIEIAVRSGSDHGVRLVAALSAKHSAGNAGEPLSIGGCCGQFAVVAGQQAQLHPGHGLRIGERAHRHRHPVAAAIGGEAEI